MFYEITSFGGSLRLINSEAVMKSVNSSIPITGYASETYSIIEHIPYNFYYSMYMCMVDWCEPSEPSTSTSTKYWLHSTSWRLFFSGVRVTRSLVLCVCLVDRCLSFCLFSFDHFVVCSSSIYGRVFAFHDSFAVYKA
jgi:hypothetical protein